MRKSFWKHHAPLSLSKQFCRVQMFTTKAQSPKDPKKIIFVSSCLGGFVVRDLGIILEPKIKNSLNRYFLLGIVQAVVEGQSHQPIADIFRDRVIAGFSTERLSHI